MSKLYEGDATPITNAELWRKCPFQGCSEPRQRHHHHVRMGRVDGTPCTCPIGRTPHEVA